MLTRNEANKVKKVKLIIIPKTIPRGRLCPSCPASEEERTIGSTGQIQGARIVVTPEIKENRSNTIIGLYATFTVPVYHIDKNSSVCMTNERIIKWYAKG
jgi:hypothetical protein